MGRLFAFFKLAVADTVSKSIGNLPAREPLLYCDMPRLSYHSAARSELKAELFIFRVDRSALN
jgi:hypothetical protein